MKRWPNVFAALGVIALAGAVAWTALAIPALVRFPGHIDRRVTYQGTITSFLDPTTGSILGVPHETPVTTTHRVQTVPSRSTHAVTVLDDMVTTNVDGQVSVEHHRYAINRRTMRLESGPDSWSGSPANLVNRRGTYRLTFPVATKRAHNYAVWSDETGRSFDVKAPARGTAKINGLHVLAFTGSLDAPVSPAYRRSLAAQGLPASITLEQLKDQLAVLGFDPAALVTGVAATAGPAAGQSVAAALREPLPLQYGYRLDGAVLDVEPRTGIIVDTKGQSTITARVDPGAVASVQAALAPLAGIPAVQRTAQILDVVGAAPAQAVIAARVGADASTVAAAVRLARRDARLLVLVRQAIPVGLLALGVAMLLLAWAMRRRLSSAASEVMVVEHDLRLAEEVDLREPGSAEAPQVLAHHDG